MNSDHSLNVGILRGKVRVVLLYDLYSIAEPLRDLEHVHAVLNKQGCEGVAHDVRRHPAHILRGGVVIVGPVEVVAVAIFALLDIVTKGELLAILPGEVSAQELAESDSQRDKAGVPILDAKRRRVFDVARAVLAEIKPAGPRLNDFPLPHSAVKSAIENEPEIIVWRIRDERVALGSRAEFEPSRFVDPGELQLCGRVFAAGVFLHAPGEERADGAHVDLGGRFGDSLLQSAVVILNVTEAHLVGSDGADGIGELPNGRARHALRGPAENVHLALAVQVARDQCIQRGLFGQGWCATYLDRPRHRHGEVVGLHAQAVPHAVARESEPVDAPALGDASGEGGHEARLCQCECANSTKTDALCRPMRPTESPIYRGTDIFTTPENRLGSCRSTIELHPQIGNCATGIVPIGRPTKAVEHRRRFVATSEIGGGTEMGRPLCKTARCRNRARKSGADCPKCHQRAWRASRPMRAAYATLRDHARSRGIVFAISFEYFERFAIEAEYIEKTGPFAGCVTVDRIDNRRGYVVDNIQALSRAENASKRMKQDAARMERGFAWRTVAA